MSALTSKVISVLRFAKGYMIAATGAPRMLIKRYTQRHQPKALVFSVGGANSSGGPLCQTLVRMGYAVTVVSGKFPTRESVYIAGWKKLDCEAQIDEIVAYAKAVNPSLVCSDHRNFLLPVKARVLEALGLPEIGHKSAVTSNDKLAFRRALDGEGVANLEWCVISEVDVEALSYPTVFKPTRGTGSRGVQKIGTKAQAADVKAQLEADGVAHEWLTEAFVKGRQFDVEGVCRNGAFSILSVTEEYYLEKDGHFPSGWFLFSPPIKDALLAQIKKAALDTMRAAGVQAGAFHCELRVDEVGKIYPIDYSNRFGYPHLVSAAAGTDFIEAYVRTLSREEFPELDIAQNCVFQRYLVSSEERSAYKRLTQENPKLVLSTGFVGAVVGDVSMFGNVCLRSENFDEMRTALNAYGVLPESWDKYYSN